MKENPLKEKSYAFALKIVATYRTLQDEQREFVLSRQLLRSGTSIGANTEEAIGVQSKRDFYQKFQLLIKRHERPIIGFDYYATVNYWNRNRLMCSFQTLKN
jgi:hypothetical protein